MVSLAAVMMAGTNPLLCVLCTKAIPSGQQAGLGIRLQVKDLATGRSPKTPRRAGMSCRDEYTNACLLMCLDTACI